MFMKKNKKEENNKGRLTLKLISFLAMLFTSNHALTQSLSLNPAPTLKQVLTAAMKISDINDNKEETKNKSSSWLSSSPTLGVSYLKSDLQQGTDETEVNVSLPIKSWFQSETDEKLYLSSQTTQTLLIENKRLMLSGFIRAKLWQIKLSEHENEIINQKLKFLTELEKQYKQLFQSASISKYPLLLIKQEKLDSQMEQLSVEQTIAKLHHQYKLLTGFTALPKEIDEQFLETDVSLGQMLVNHPQIRKLDQSWFEQTQQLKLASNKSQPWNLSFNAKNLNNNVINETQIGIAAEVPLTMFDIKSQAINSGWLVAKGSYELARANRLVSLRDTYVSLWANQQVLLKKNDLLIKAKLISTQIITETKLVIEANQINQDTAIRRMLTAFNTKSKLTTNKLLLLKNSALLNQAVGISL